MFGAVGCSSCWCWLASSWFLCSAYAAGASSSPVCCSLPGVGPVPVPVSTSMSSVFAVLLLLLLLVELSLLSLCGACGSIAASGPCWGPALSPCSNSCFGTGLESICWYIRANMSVGFPPLVRALVTLWSESLWCGATAAFQGADVSGWGRKGHSRFRTSSVVWLNMF